MIKSLAYIFGCLLIGNIIQTFLHISIPGSIIGMLLLTAALHFKVLLLEDVKAFASLLNKNMAFLFVPPGVALINYIDMLQSNLLAILGSCAVSTVLILVVVSLTMSKLDPTPANDE
ncbi:CidA/LrgA family protein [Persicobacter psychrovividus]|uniref:CidA/LrgA family protein n=1 Tax=Persicobacter psychrovividus TaxID=387638 RepID=A0ABN6L6J4_9BACT|nr:CidA/LrgA family protein [Persicobacter psychrovividus]